MTTACAPSSGRARADDDQRETDASFGRQAPRAPRGPQRAESPKAPESPKAIRILPELRATHLEQRMSFAPAQFVYFTTNYDLARTSSLRDVHRVNLFSLLLLLAVTDARVIELTEPLWMRFLPKWLVIAIWWRLVGIARRRRVETVVYAKENNDLSTLIGGGRVVPRAVLILFRFSIGLAVRLLVDRICFATPASAAVYQSLPFVPSVRQHQLIDLPAPAVVVPHRQEGPVAAFVGVLEKRKGIPQLLRAWELVEATLPEARLIVAGPGPLSDEVDAWAAERPSSREYRGQLHHNAVSSLWQESRVLVSPSVPEGRWREQVCLPIQEALAHGVTVVSTSQTGLASWLHATGHEVVDVSRDMGDLVADLAAAIERSLTRPLDRTRVLRSLPAVGGWQRANAWLHPRPATDQGADSLGEHS